MNASIPLSLSMVLLGSSVSAQVEHRSPDPDPQTRRCQEQAAAFHNNGDVVLVEYRGQWRTHAQGRSTQNGGRNHASCELERIVRLDPDGREVWAVETSHASQRSTGFLRGHEITSLTALEDGSTLVALLHDHGTDERLTESVLVLLDDRGAMRWRRGNQSSVQFSMATPVLGERGEIFVGYTATNFGYAGGVFQLPGGKVYRLRKNSPIRVLARLRPSDGGLLWEKKNLSPVFAQGGELIALDEQWRGSVERRQSRRHIFRLSYEGRRRGRGSTPWLPYEPMLSAARFGDHLAITTTQALRDSPSERPRGHIGLLRIYDLRGRPVTTIEIGHGAKIAKPTEGAPLRTVGPVECLEALKATALCVTSAIEVTTLEALDRKPVRTLLAPEGLVLDSSAFHALSLDRGVWLSAKSYESNGTERQPREGTIALYEPDRLQRLNPDAVWVWRPRPRSTKPTRNPFSGF